MKFLSEKRKWLFLTLLFVATALVVGAVFVERSRATLIVAFLDVGQGDAILTVWTLFTPMSLELGSLT